MAITSPRVILACAVPVLIVILSYIWFKKKEKQQPNRPNKSELTSSRSGNVNINSACEQVDVRQEVVDERIGRNRSVEGDNLPADEEESRSEAAASVEADCVEQFVDDDNDNGDDEPDVSRATIEIEPIEFNEDTIVGQSEPEQVDVEPESVTIESLVLEVSARDEERRDKMVSDTVSRNRDKKSGQQTEETREPLASVDEQINPEPAKSLATCSSNGSVDSGQNESVAELSERIDDIHIVATSATAAATATVTPPLSPLDESANCDAVTPEGSDSPSSQSNCTLVDDQLDVTVVDCRTSNVDAEVTSPSEDVASPPCVGATNSPQTSNGHGGHNGDEALDDDDDLDVDAPNSVTGRRGVASEQLPTSVSSPGSIDGSDVVRKAVKNGTDTSAYGSVSHSPAEELLESPTVSSNYSDVHSEGSSDSGKGCGEIRRLGGEGSGPSFPLTPMSVFEFELPQELCGRLIGQKGRYVNYIKSKSRANISIKKHPFNVDLKLCAVIGTEEDINLALVIIRKRFPLARFPCISMVQVNAPLLSNVPIPDTLQLHLPEGVTCDVILSSLVTAGHFFVQQPTHPTFPSLGRLDQCMLHCYINGMGAPELPKPVEAGVICAASTMGGWYRAQIVYVQSDTDECEVRFVDYGGYSQEAISSLRQIRSDFMTLPFQASECYLANVVPIDENQGWTIDAMSLFEEMAQGQILQAQIISYSEEGIPHVHLYRIQGVTTKFINRELVECGVAKWVDHHQA